MSTSTHQPQAPATPADGHHATLGPPGDPPERGGRLGRLAVRFLLGRLQGLVFMLVIALFLPFALEPGVYRLAARGWRRGGATGAIMGGLVVLCGVLVGAMVPPAGRAAPGAGRHLPGWRAEVDRSTERWFDISVSTDHEASLASATSGTAGGLLGSAADRWRRS